jgi:hypothetical protein
MFLRPCSLSFPCGLYHERILAVLELHLNTELGISDNNLGLRGNNFFQNKGTNSTEKKAFKIKLLKSVFKEMSSRRGQIIV